jgi:hypothetical protein
MSGTLTLLTRIETRHRACEFKYLKGSKDQFNFSKRRLKMKKKLMTIGLALAILFSIGLVNQAQANTTVGFNLFFDALAPYGTWVSTPDYG